MMEVDTIEEISSSAGDKSNMQKILLCCNTKSLQKQAVFCPTNEKALTNSA